MIAVRAAVLTIQKAKPDAVITIGANKPCAEFIKVARQPRMAARPPSTSRSSAATLWPRNLALPATAWRSPRSCRSRDTAHPLVARYQAALKAQNAQARSGFVSLEGYLAGRLAIAALGMMEGAPDREGLPRTLRANKFDIDGFPLTFGADRDFGSDAVYLTVIDAGGELRPVDSLIAAKG
jgi:branched-chain amino acid transport system substrate-binding protein